MIHQLHRIFSISIIIINGNTWVFNQTNMSIPAYAYPNL